MSSAAKLLRLLDGWKLVIGVVVLFVSKVFDALNNGHSGDLVGSILSALGWLPTGYGFDAQSIAVASASALALWGFVSKMIKAQKQLRAGTSIAGLLSTEGYVSQYIKDGKE